MHLSPTGLHFWPRAGFWTVGGRGGPGLTQERRTENHDVSRPTLQVAVRAGNPSHSYHPEGFYSSAKSPQGRKKNKRKREKEGGTFRVAGGAPLPYPGGGGGSPPEGLGGGL